MLPCYTYSLLKSIVTQVIICVQVLRDWLDQAPGDRRLQAPDHHPGSGEKDRRVQGGVPERLLLGDPGQAPH